MNKKERALAQLIDQQKRIYDYLQREDVQGQAYHVMLSIFGDLKTAIDNVAKAYGKVNDCPKCKGLPIYRIYIKPGWYYIEMCDCLGKQYYQNWSVSDV